LKIETAFGRSFLFVRVCSRLSPDHLKKSGKKLRAALKELARWT
jgi:hypothetical protein